MAVRGHLLVVGSEVPVLDPVIWNSSLFSDPLAAVQAIRNGGVDAVWARLPLSGWAPLEFLDEIQRAAPGVPVVFEGAPGEDTFAEAISLIRMGAFDYVRPGSDCPAVLGALEGRSRAGERPILEPWAKLVVGESPGVRTILDTIRLIGKRRSTVLITGETGTGKEVVARAIHAASDRAQQPLVAVNCGAIPASLLEAELFGHVKGAFTGAVNHRTGLFEQARGSTIFLDEITEMPLELQAKLLRVLQEREIQRLGSSETVKVDVRVIAACNVDPAERVREGELREDLYYRLNVVPIPVPPLRDRRGDIPLLARHFLDKVCRHEGLPARNLPAETLDRLSLYDWPGNVRQLENAIEKAVILSGERLTLASSDFHLTATRLTPAAPSAEVYVPDEGLDFERTLERIERGILEQALRRTRGNKKAAAELLRLKRTTLTAKLKSLDAAAAKA